MSSKIYKKRGIIQNMKKIYRGIWADRLEAGEELPIGGSVFQDELTIKLMLDFDSFNADLENYRSPEKVSELYALNRSVITNWLSQVGSKIDPYLFFVANTVKGKVQAMMNIKPESPSSDLERRIKFKDDKVKLTDLKGVAMCAEQAALGQYLLQQVLEIGYFSSYMSGVTADNPASQLSNHSFIVVNDPNLETYIFDIARPTLQHNLPRILKTDVTFNYELFRWTENLLVGATEVLQGRRLYFGVGNTMLEEEPIVLQC